MGKYGPSRMRKNRGTPPDTTKHSLSFPFPSRTSFFGTMSSMYGSIDGYADTTDVLIARMADVLMLVMVDTSSATVNRLNMVEVRAYPEEAAMCSRPGGAAGGGTTHRERFAGVGRCVCAVCAPRGWLKNGLCSSDDEAKF